MIVSARSSTSPKSTFSALVSTSETPLVRDTMTGTSNAMASSGAMPKGSVTDGMTETSASRVV